MKKYILNWYRNRIFMKGELFIGDGINTEVVPVNMFYTVDKDWFIIYDEVGGCGTGYSKGNVRRKIYIGDAEFKKIDC